MRHEFPRAIRTLLCVAAMLALCSPARAATSQLAASLADPALAIQTALAADDGSGVAAQASALAQAAAGLGPAAAPLASAAAALAAQTDLAAMRRLYGELSAALVAYVRAEKLALPDGIRPAYCPMARRPWLQKDGAIRNPYYGRAMTTCGEFTD
jgi:predicted phage gp36 major capsid-like protein